MSEQDNQAGHRCFRCERPVSDDDVAAGKAYFRDGYYVCPDCLEQIKKGTRHDEIDTLKSQLAAMTAELRNISQHLHYEEFSWLFVLGGGLQVLVLYVLYRVHGAAAADKVSTLLWAVVLQLMTITAFVVGKLK